MIETIYAVDARLLGIVPNAGQDISAAFQAAVNNLSSGGGKLGTSLQLAPGTYLFKNDAQISIPDGITIDGAGNDTILQLGTENPLLAHTIFIVPDAAMVIFKNIAFQGPIVSAVNVFAVDKQGSTGTLILLNCTATNPTHALVRVATGCTFALEDCAEIGTNFWPEAATETWQHLDNGLWTGGSMPRQIKGTVDPSAGAGVPAAEGSIFQRQVVGAGTLWVKTGSLDTAWTLVNTGGGGVPPTRAIIAGDGLTGGGTLAADVTLDVGANADGSIVVNADDIQVGVLATDAQHGDLGGGSLHDLVTTSVDGFMSAADKSKLDAITPGGGGSCVLFWGNSDVGAAADTRFMSPGRQDIAASLSSVYDLPVPRDGTLQNFFIRHNTAGGDGDDVVYTVMVNGVATAITATRATGVVGQSSDLVNTVAVVQGDRVSVQLSKAAGITSGLVDASASLEFTS